MVAAYLIEITAKDVPKNEKIVEKLQCCHSDEPKAMKNLLLFLGILRYAQAAKKKFQQSDKLTSEIKRLRDRLVFL
ncbi:MAG: hypothetical protein ACREBU_15325 [Nitrososphaera sp.]